MEPRIVAGQDEAVKHLLDEGVRTYLDAASAIIAFEREVQKKCKNLLDKFLDAYNVALQIQPHLKSEEIRNCVWPKSNDEFDGSWRSLGAAIEGKSPPGIRWWGTYCLLEWDRTDQRLNAWIGEWIAPRTMAERVYQKFHALNAEVLIDVKEVGIWKPIKVDEAANFEEKLEATMCEWIGLWKKVGGLKRVFKE
jgi:hypothetical protein